MKIEIGKWYWIDYRQGIKSKHFVGAAKCIFHWSARAENDGYEVWNFFSPNRETSMHFQKQDIKREVKPLPKYSTLYAFWKKHNN